MTKEELEKEAEEYAFAHWADTDEKGDYFADDVLIKQAYLAGAEPREKRIAELEKENAELKEFYEIEYFQIADRTADEKIKELEKHQVEVTIDDYSPYDENTWGDMHEEWFVPKEEVRDLLKENYALLTKAKEIIKDLLSLCEGETDSKLVFTRAEQFLNSEVEK